MREAGLDGLARHLPAVVIEQRQFAARLAQPAHEVAALGFGRPRRAGRRLSIRVGVRCLSPLIHSAIPLTMINRRLQSQFQSAGWADRIDERRSIVLAGQVGPEPFREGIATFHTQSSMIRKGVTRT